jgi:hypothetical protein
LSSTRNRFLVVAAIFCCSHAYGALPDEIQVYIDDVNAPGERGLELHVNTTPSGRSTPGYPGEVPTHHGLRITPEISWGLARNWDGALYLPFVRSGDGTNYFAGPRFRLKWMPVRPAEGGAGAFAGINWEISFVERRFEEARRTAEIRPIVGYRNDDWLFSLNPIVDVNLAAPQKGVLTFAPAFKIARSTAGGRAIGAEYYAELGPLSHFAPSSEQSHTLYFVLDTQKLNFGVGRGLNGATDRWTLKSIISF